MTTGAGTLRGDLTGGLVAGVLSLPEAMAFGALVFSAVSPELASVGVVAGLVALAVSNMIGTLVGGVRIMNTGPYALACLMLVSAVELLIGSQPEMGQRSELVSQHLLLLVLMAGLIQILFGLLKIGNLAKYIPYPVVAGLMNGLAILIFVGQIRPILGLPPDAKLTWGSAADLHQPLTLIVGVATIAAIFVGRKVRSKIPPPILGILVGCGTYYLLAWLRPAAALGPTVGDIPFAIPAPRHALAVLSLPASDTLLLNLPALLGLSAGVALVCSMRTLLGAVAIDSVTHERSNTNRELIGQGLGNMVGSLFGAVPVAGYSGQPIASYTYGGRTRLARLTVGLFALAVLVVLGPLVGKLPGVVLAGMLVTIAWGMVDRWSLDLFYRVLTDRKISRVLLFDVALVLSVACLMVFVGILEGVAGGVLASVITFVHRMSKNPVRRLYNATRVRSNCERRFEEILLLEKHGHRICVFELEGSLFFGTTDQLADAIDRLIDPEVKIVIVDLRRITDVDSTATNLLGQLSLRLEELGVVLLLSSVDEEKSLGRQLRQLGFLDRIDSRRVFVRVDAALTHAEDSVLDDVLAANRYECELGLSGIDCLNELTAAELETLERYLRHTDLAEGEVLFEQGQSGDEVFLIGRGQIELRLTSSVQGETSEKLIATLCPGTVCGEMALLDRRPRSATAVTKGAVTLYGLSQSKLAQLRTEEPDIAYKLMTGLGQELAKRVRIANRLNTELRA